MCKENVATGIEAEGSIKVLMKRKAVPRGLRSEASIFRRLERAVGNTVIQNFVSEHFK